MDSGLGDGRSRFVLSWGVITDRRRPSLPIIDQLDVFKDILTRLFTSHIAPLVYQLMLECPEEAFDIGIVSAITFAAHTGDEAVPIN